jgi:hypothetical protein
LVKNEILLFQCAHVLRPVREAVVFALMLKHLIEGEAFSHQFGW